MFSQSAQATLTFEKPNLKLRVINYDDNKVIVSDMKGADYQIPRREFKVKKFKIYQIFEFYSSELKYYQIKKPSKKRKANHL